MMCFEDDDVVVICDLFHSDRFIVITVTPDYHFSHHITSLHSVTCHHCPWPSVTISHKHRRRLSGSLERKCNQRKKL